MTPTTVSLYDLTTGAMSGVILTLPASQLASNVPQGLGAIPGRHDPQRTRVVMADDGFGNADPVARPCKPARPADTALIAYDWSDDADDWVGTPTRAALMQQLRAERDARLAASDVLALRALESLLPADLRAYRQALRDVPQVAEAAADVSPLAVVLPDPPDTALPLVSVG